jgi:hypothetical protein
MTTATSPSYRKTKSGEWVVFGPAATVRPGRVNVAKRDGTTKAETVERVGRPFVVDGVECVYGYIAERGATTPATSSGLDMSREAIAARNRAHFGSYECEECGERVRPGTRCWETGMAH